MPYVKASPLPLCSLASSAKASSMWLLCLISKQKMSLMGRDTSLLHYTGHAAKHMMTGP